MGRRLVPHIQKPFLQRREIEGIADFEMDRLLFKARGVWEISKQRGGMGYEDFLLPLLQLAQSVKALGKEFPRRRKGLRPEKLIAGEKDDVVFVKEIEQKLIKLLRGILIWADEGVIPWFLFENGGEKKAGPQNFVHDEGSLSF